LEAMLVGGGHRLLGAGRATSMIIVTVTGKPEKCHIGIGSGQSLSDVNEIA
jgi:hypothetical protein